MEPEKQENLFDVRLNDVGRNYILKTARLAGGVLVLGILNSTFSFFSTGYRMLRLTAMSNQFYTRIYFIADIAIMIIGILNIIAAVKYWTFISQARKGITNVNEGQFNLSFKFIYSNMILGLVIILLNILVLLFYFVQSTI